MTRDDLNLLAPADTGAVTIGEGLKAYRVIVRPLKVGKLPAFARAVRPLSAEIERMLASGLTVGGVLGLVETNLGDVLEALQVATDAPRDSIEDATIEQVLELVLAVLSANKDFLRGRLTAALRTAATLTPGAGPTPSQP